MESGLIYHTQVPGNTGMGKTEYVARRLAISDKLTFLGKEENSTFIPVYLPDAERIYNTFVMGSRESGRDEIVFSMIAQDIIKGYGACMFDPRQDDDFIERLVRFLKSKGLISKFHYFNMGNPDNSQRYNPFAKGSPDEVSRRIVFALDEDNSSEAILFFSNIITIFRLIHSETTVSELILFVEMFTNQNILFPNIPADSNVDVLSLMEECRTLYNSKIASIVEKLSAIFTYQGNQKYNPLSLMDGSCDIDISTIIANGGIVYFGLPLMKYSVLSKTISKMIAFDIMLSMNHRASNANQSNFYPLYINEPFSFFGNSLERLLLQTRVSNIGITISFDSFSGLSGLVPEFRNVLLNNFINSIILNQNDTAYVQDVSVFLGTNSKEVDVTSLHNNQTRRIQVEEFNIHPNLINNSSTLHGVAKIRGLSDPIRVQYSAFPDDTINNKE